MFEKVKWSLNSGMFFFFWSKLNLSEKDLLKHMRRMVTSFFGDLDALPMLEHALFQANFIFDIFAIIFFAAEVGGSSHSSRARENTFISIENLETSS